MNEFQKQYIQEWDTSRDRRLWELAKTYHDRCEAYDLTVCSGPMGRDGIMPSNHYEMGKINRNAREVLADVLKIAKAEGFSGEDVQRAISRYSSDQPSGQ